MKTVIGLSVLLLCGCVSVAEEPKQAVVFYDTFGREHLHDLKIPSCSSVTLKKDVKECVVR